VTEEELDMKPNNVTGRTSLATALGVFSVALLSVIGSTTAQAADPVLSMLGATGVPGGTVSVTFSLTGNTAGMAVGAQANILYDSSVLAFNGQFASTQCTLGCPSSSDHAIFGGATPGNVLLEVSPLPGVFPEVPFAADCNDLANCKFQINPNAAVGAMTALNVQNLILTDSLGTHLPVTAGTPGIVVVAAPNPTPTPTSLTSATATPPATATAVHTNTAVAPTLTPTVHVTTPTAIVGSPTATPTTTGEMGGSPTTTAGSPTTAPTTPTSAPTTPSAVPTTPTSGPTNTPASPTVTHGSPTTTAKNTRTPVSGIGKESDSCNIVAPGESSSGGGLALLLAPALLIWARRRRL
jgi:hypothetical protein